MWKEAALNHEYFLRKGVGAEVNHHWAYVLRGIRLSGKVTQTLSEALKHRGANGTKCHKPACDFFICQNLIATTRP